MIDEQDQKLLIELILSDSSVFTRVRPILKPKYFEKKFQPTLEYILRFSDEYNTIPTIEQINNEARIEYKLVKEVNNNINIQQSVLDMTEKFCKQKAIECAILKSSQLLAEGNPNAIESIIKKALLVSISNDLGINYWENPLEWLTKVDELMGLIPTGWETFDEIIGGGLSWGQLNYISSPSGGGKSLVAANLALNWSLMGYNVIYFTLELDKELIAKRILSMDQQVPYRNIKDNIEQLSKEVVHKAEFNKPGVLQLIEKPSGINTHSIEADIQRFEMEKNIIPQIIVVDYAGIMRPSDKRIDINNIHLRDGAISAELRELARGRTHQGKKTMVLTAAQITKDASAEMEFEINNIAGGNTLVHNCDNLFTVRTNELLRQKGLYQFKILKARNSGGTGKTFNLHYNVDTLRVSNLESTQSHNAPIITETSKTESTNNVPQSNELKLAQETLQKLKQLSK